MDRGLHNTTEDFAPWIRDLKVFFPYKTWSSFSRMLRNIFVLHPIYMEELSSVDLKTSGSTWKNCLTTSLVFRRDVVDGTTSRSGYKTSAVN